MIKRILIANRGEIAVRIIRTCRRLGIETVAVYSEADRTALHVRMADYAFLLGAPPARDSYLAMDKVLKIAKSAGADAVHPGYGFLSENAEFAQSVGDNDLIWIGPPPESIRKMGDKLEARQLMESAGVPVVPGSMGPIADPAAELEAAKRAEFPILIKAVAGGGGKGMRIVERPEDWHDAVERAGSEALNAFGDGRVFWEKLLVRPRHIEIQVVSDSDGKAVHLGERECSIQRRHQKVIEESPSVAVNAELRETMGQAAVAAAESCGYRGAGTVEFLLDQSGKFYFLEMNTRLQVEHPVTEFVRGIDLVKAQVDIASGRDWERDRFQREPFGHALEYRIYAEDPEHNFAPSPGTLEVYREPHGPGVRVDSGVYQGAEIPIYYDPMISKLVVWGRDREEALARSRAALEEYVIAGVTTTIAFHRSAIELQAFREGDLSTAFISEQWPDGFGDGEGMVGHDDNKLAAILAASLYARRRTRRASRFAIGGEGGGGDGTVSAASKGTNWKTSARRAMLRGVLG